jgi:hypothetical protein
MTSTATSVTGDLHRLGKAGAVRIVAAALGTTHHSPWRNPAPHRLQDGDHPQAGKRAFRTYPS